VDFTLLLLLRVRTFMTWCLNAQDILLVLIFIVMNLVTFYQLRISLLYLDDSISSFSLVEVRWQENLTVKS